MAMFDLCFAFLKINCENKSLDVCNVIFTYWNKDNEKNVFFNFDLKLYLTLL